jgi:sugar fermentation stimulation protein A
VARPRARRWAWCRALDSPIHSDFPFRGSFAASKARSAASYTSFSGTPFSSAAFRQASNLQGYESIRREVLTRRGTRLDLCLEGSIGSCFVEVKNVTLAVGGTAAFPDAVSERGTRHLQELIRLRRRGHRAALVFVIQRNDCRCFRPADEIDREYGRWLRRAVKAGVEALPYTADVTPREIALTERLPLKL